MTEYNKKIFDVIKEINVTEQTFQKNMDILATLMNDILSVPNTNLNPLDRLILTEYTNAIKNLSLPNPLVMSPDPNLLNGSQTEIELAASNIAEQVSNRLKSKNEAFQKATHLFLIVNTISTKLEKNEKTKALLDAHKSNPNNLLLDLPSFLIMPVQRTPRYSILLQSLEEKITTPEIAKTVSAEKEKSKTIVKEKINAGTPGNLKEQQAYIDQFILEKNQTLLKKLLDNTSNLLATPRPKVIIELLVGIKNTINDTQLTPEQQLTSIEKIINTRKTSLNKLNDPTNDHHDIYQTLTAFLKNNQDLKAALMAPQTSSKIKKTVASKLKAIGKHAPNLPSLKKIKQTFFSVKQTAFKNPFRSNKEEVNSLSKKNK